MRRKKGASESANEHLVKVFNNRGIDDFKEQDSPSAPQLNVGRRKQFNTIFVETDDLKLTVLL